MDIAINAVSLAFLLSLTGYAVMLGFGNMRVARATVETAVVERELLRKRIDQLTDQQRFVREKGDLSWNGYRKFEVLRKVQEGGGICSFYLAPHDKKDLPPFEPGQYLTFQLPIPGQRKPVVRCYSLSDSPYHPECYRVSIKALPPPRKEPDAPPGLSSNYFHDSINETDILDVKAPGGHFFMDTTKHTPVVLIGGGVGITPVMSMLNQICESGSTREVWFFYGVTNGSEHIMREHMERLASEHENVTLQICYSRPGDDDVQGQDYHHAERVSVDLFKRVLPSNNYDFYICGPPPMMKSLTEGLKKWGVPDDHVYFEAFGPASVKKAPAETKKEGADAGPKHKIVFAKSNKTLPWNTSDGSILDFALANGVNIDSGCRAGNCGTCVTAIKSGQVTYIHEPGTAPETGTCLTCISGPSGDLTLDA